MPLNNKDGPSEKSTEGCPVREVLDRLGDKWSVLIILTINVRTIRFTEIKKGIPDISQRMLTLTLRHLERDGIVKRMAYPVVPPRVEYALTALGKSFLEKANALVEWASKNRPRIDASRSLYDREMKNKESEKDKVMEISPG